MSSSASTNATGSGAGGATIRLVPRPGYTIIGGMKTLDMGETCSFTQVDTRGCRAPRSCQSCLETTGCMVGSNGQCMNPRNDEPYDPRIEYRNAIAAGLVVQGSQSAQLSASQRWQFPAGTARYCPASDATCSECTRQNFWRPNTTFPDSRFCVGDDGACVCVDVCERRWYVREDCGSLSSLTQMPTNYLTSETLFERLWRGLLSVAVFVGIVLLLMLRKQYVAKRIARQRQEELERQDEARQARRHARSRSLGVNVLTLNGWESHRRELIDKETAQLAGEGDESKTWEVRLDDSSDDAADSDSEIQSPRVAGDVSSAAYVSLEESGPGNTTTRSSVASNARLSAYNEAIPSRQSLAPLSGRDHRTSV